MHLKTLIFSFLLVFAPGARQHYREMQRARARAKSVIEGASGSPGAAGGIESVAAFDVGVTWGHMWAATQAVPHVLQHA